MIEVRTLNLQPASRKAHGRPAAAQCSRRCESSSSRGTPGTAQRCGHGTGARAQLAPCADTVSWLTSSDT